MDCKAKNICIDEAVTVRLWNTENMSENILQSRLDKKQKICTFTHLSSRNRYAITVDNMPDISISVSSRLTFCEAFSQTSLDKGTQRKTTENELPSLTQCTA